MCLALPGKILSIHSKEEIPFAEVDFSGVVKSVCLIYTPQANEGDYVIVHVGFSLSLLDEEAALKTLNVLPPKV